MAKKSKKTTRTIGDKVAGRYYRCPACGSKMMMNGTCKKCGFTTQKALPKESKKNAAANNTKLADNAGKDNPSAA